MDFHVPHTPKLIREALCAAQTNLGYGIGYDANRELYAHILQDMIDECDRQRPLGNDGKHGDNHTERCGCDDVKTSDGLARFDPRPKPPNDRPIRAASADGPEMVVINGTKRYTYRQIGWQGHSGWFYAYDEDPSKYEYGGFSPIWVCVHSDHHEPMKLM